MVLAFITQKAELELPLEHRIKSPRRKELLTKAEWVAARALKQTQHCILLKEHRHYTLMAADNYYTYWMV